MPGKQPPLEGEVVSLATMIEYQKNTIVSRTILHQPGGTVTLFAIDQGQELSEHTAPFDAMVYLIQGEADIIIGGESRFVKQGEMLIMPAQVPHALKSITPFKMLLVMVRKTDS